MMNSKQMFAALALVAVASSVSLAQNSTDFGSPMGAGGGLGGMMSLGVPGGSTGTGGASGLSGNGAAGLANARASFSNAGANGLTVQNPAGGTVVLPQAAANALGAVLGGNPTPAQMSAATSAMSGVPAGPSGALVRALQAFGASANSANLIAATQAYNNAINALPAGTNPPPALLAVRQALAAAAR